MEAFEVDAVRNDDDVLGAAPVVRDDVAPRAGRDGRDAGARVTQVEGVERILKVEAQPPPPPPRLARLGRKVGERLHRRRRDGVAGEERGRVPGGKVEVDEIEAPPPQPRTRPEVELPFLEVALAEAERDVHELDLGRRLRAHQGGEHGEPVPRRQPARQLDDAAADALDAIVVPGDERDARAGHAGSAGGEARRRPNSRSSMG
jgi:hypothetical protein